jgi:lipopolysaccharide transport system permease protein
MSSLTTKYRDLRYLVGFGVHLLMYGTPVIYPLSKVASSRFAPLILANPMTHIIETFRYAYLGKGAMDPFALLYTACCAAALLFIGTLIFSRIEKTFMDTV